MKNSIITKTSWGEELDSQREYYIEDEEVRWTVSITAELVNNLNIPEDIIESLSDNFNIDKKDLVVELDWFFPNILKNPEEWASLKHGEMWIWRWGKILKEIESDMRDEWKTTLFCITWEVSMINFLRKNSFKEIETDSFPQRFFLKII